MNGARRAGLLLALALGLGAGGCGGAAPPSRATLCTAARAGCRLVCDTAVGALCAGTAVPMPDGGVP